MDAALVRSFFLKPSNPLQRQYEVLRAVLVDEQPMREVAERFGYRYDTVRALVSEFRRQFKVWTASPLFVTPGRGRPAGSTLAASATNADVLTADCQSLKLTPGRKLRSRLAGLFLFLPLLVRLRFDDIVRAAGYPGSCMVPAPSALLSLLALKLLDKERRSHIDDFNCDEALGLFAGLNILPKKSFATDYSYRTQRTHQQQLLSGWVKALAPLLFPTGSSFSLDFHSIPFRGDPSGLDNHFLAKRGKAGPSILTLFAQEHDSRVLCYANANLLRPIKPPSRCVSSSSGTR